MRGKQGAMTLKRNVFKKEIETRNQKKGRLNFYFFFYLLPFILFLFPSAAQAARLQSWRFDLSQNRLEFTTDEGVQPTAQLIANPNRLVIDLPGIVLGRPAMTESYGGAIKSVRVGQFDRGTTRIVVEMASGYTIDPSQVKFRGATSQQWSVQLPTPQIDRSANVPDSAALPDNAVTVPTQSPISSSPIAATRSFIQNVQPTPDGFFIRTTGGAPQVRSIRSGDRRQMFVDLYGAAISPNLTSRNFISDRNGSSRLQVSQLQASVVRLTLTISPNSPDWQATPSGTNGLVLLPQVGTIATPQPINPPLAQNQGGLATIQAVELDEGNRQLVIRADRPITYTSGWDRASGSYRITVPAAQLDRSVRGPSLSANSPLLQVRLRQENARTVAILLAPAAGVQIGDINQPSRQLLALQLRRSGLFPVSPPSSSPGSNIPVPPATNPIPTVPRVPNGRMVVVIDPGHGGPDPGAVGVGGLQEKEIVMDISRQVAAILEQQGVQSVLTRSNDIDLDLEPRVALAERLNATLFVSIHANAISLSRPDISGLETYYFDSGLGLAQSIHSSVLQGTGARDRGVRKARFYVLRKTSMPSVLVEVGFVTGRDDAAKLSTASYRRQMAESIARGILQYRR
jgi:N-acetylmuramoyl-L-alanine amidase